MSSLIAVPDLSTISSRLASIFPEGLEDRIYCIRDMAASTIFTLFYLDAVEGSGRTMRPSQVTLMSDSQAARRSDEDRLGFAHATLSRRKTQRLQPPADRWYQENTREPIRDETLRDGLMKYGAVTALEVAPTSDRPRYALARDFASLFLADDREFQAACKRWQRTHLSADARRRALLLRRGALASRAGIVVRFPSGTQSLPMSPGDSSMLTKAFVEVFAPRFLATPVVLFISESGNKAPKYLNDLMRELGLVLDQARLLPDVLLLDVGSDPQRLVFAEVVATDGPIREDRKQAFLEIARRGNFDEAQCSFVTVFTHRGSSSFRKTVNSLAWGTFAWFMNEPDKLVAFSDSGRSLAERL